MIETVQMTRYERVQEILDRAAGSSAADHGGHGRFWRLPCRSSSRERSMGCG